MAVSQTAPRRLWPVLLSLLALTASTAGSAAAQSLPSGVYRAGYDDVTFPRATRQVEPVYPIAARSAGVHGEVRLEVIVAPDGTVQDARVTRSLDTVHGLDAEALRAAKAWLFEPGLRNGTPVPVAVTMEMTFAISPEVESVDAPRSGRLRLVLLPYSALRKAVNAVFRFDS